MVRSLLPMVCTELPCVRLSFSSPNGSEDEELNNNLVFLPENIFTHLSSLKNLRLQNSSIISLQNGTLKVPPLQNLDLRDNNLRQLSTSTMSEISRKPGLHEGLAGAGCLQANVSTETITHRVLHVHINKVSVPDHALSYAWQSSHVPNQDGSELTGPQPLGAGPCSSDAPGTEKHREQEATTMWRLRQRDECNLTRESLSSEGCVGMGHSGSGLLHQQRPLYPQATINWNSW
ncbi:hypothetical protein WMY93_026089 [Mugilogobius chulae]|uniref:Uncharacterized protein n=1 Tax=Mugilogobius chulae TaxID=88201 RepID=A0AAW0N6J7_9GOBI